MSVNDKYAHTTKCELLDHLSLQMCKMCDTITKMFININGGYFYIWTFFTAICWNLGGAIWL